MDIETVPGVGEKTAAALSELDDPGGFAATTRAREVYREALSLLKARTVTDDAERRLETFYPSTVESRVEESRAFARRAMDRDPDPDRLSTAVDGLDAAVSTAESVANDRLRAAIEERDVPIECSDLLGKFE